MPNDFFSRENLENLEKEPSMPTQEELEASIEDPKNTVLTLIGHMVDNKMMAFKLDIDTKRFDDTATMRLLALGIKALKNVLYKIGEENDISRKEIDNIINDDSDGNMRFL